MLNIIGFFQDIIDFIADIWNSGVQAVTGLWNTFQAIGTYLNTLLNIFPAFLQPIAGLILFLAGAALVIRIMPFFG